MPPRTLAGGSSPTSTCSGSSAASRAPSSAGLVADSIGITAVYLTGAALLTAAASSDVKE